MGRELRMFESYLQNRKQYVEMSSAKSDILDYKCGVPQGSCLGPLLFSIYLNDLSNLNLAGRLYMFADDVCLFYPYKYDLVLKTNMERDVSLIFEFARVNKLVLNASKTKLVRFKPNSHIINDNFSILVDGNVVQETHDVKYLGITLQSNLSWDLHICEVKRKIAPAIGILYKMKNKLTTKTKLLLYNALVQSHLNYMVIIYGYKCTNVLKPLQSMQNKALKVIHSLPATYSTHSLYNDVCKPIMPIHVLYKYQVLLYIFKSLNNIGYHTINFLQNQSAFNTRNQQNLRVPRCRLETTKQRIEYKGIIEYNQLPATLKNHSRISLYKKYLKEHLFQNLETLLL